jgi:hypothetical protein
VLGPLLFNIYANDLCSAASRSTLVQYADDTTILVKSKKSAAEFTSKVECAVDEIIKWFNENRLQLNYKKSRLVVFGRNRHVITISACDSVKLLGLQIDSNLSYTSHVN